MTDDPWADVRKEIDNVMRFSMDGVDANRVELLLTDADALLRYYRAHQAHEKGAKGAISFTLLMELREAQAALPKRLK